VSAVVATPAGIEAPPMPHPAPSPTPDQRAAARIAGVLYVVTNLTAIFAYWVRGAITESGDAVASARNIIERERLFRTGAACELLTIVLVLALAVALHHVLRRVGPARARLALAWRLGENIVLATSLLTVYTALGLLTRTTALGGLAEAQRQALAYVCLRVHGSGFDLGFVFLGFGSALFGWLWLRSGYVPHGFAWLGIVASLLLAGATLAILIVPAIRQAIGLWYMAPMGLYEFGFGFWLTFARLREPR
jgi:hypothetical protein